MWQAWDGIRVAQESRGLGDVYKSRCVDRADAGVRDLGCRGRVLIRCDGEPALKALRNAITKALPEGATPIEPPVGESASNGGLEGGVRIVKGRLLPLRHI